MTITINGTTGIAGVDGSASTPAVQGTDTNTGIFFPAADTIAFGEGGAEVMRINSSGYVGIGTSSPSQALEVNGRVLASSMSVSSVVYIWSQNRMSLGASVGIESQQSSPLFMLTQGVAQPIVFGTNSTERARITSGGELAIGSSGGSANGLSVVGAATLCLMKNTSATDGTARTTILFRDNGDNTRGSITVSTSGTVYNTTSDYRLKENIAPMTGALAKVAQLNPVTYTWKETGDVGQGFIAHELQQLFPDAVTGDKDAVEERDGKEFIVPQGIDTSFLVATLTAAIQELKAELDTTKARLAALEAQ